MLLSEAKRMLDNGGITPTGSTDERVNGLTDKTT